MIVALLRDREAGLAKLIRQRIFVHLHGKSGSKCMGDGQNIADHPIHQIDQHDFICAYAGISRPLSDRQAASASSV